MKRMYLLAALLWAQSALAAKQDCALPLSQNDAIAQLLRDVAECPRDVFAFRLALLGRGARLETTLVANRGFHNPTQGSFSMFEMATGPLSTQAAVKNLELGDFFFGHFTARDGQRLVADQNTVKGSLMIEAFAWDAPKGLYNFYELRGDGQTGRWFYRGDSADILYDLRLLHQQPVPSKPEFGGRLRCSGCHMAGGPIMKELSAPHNDWWTLERGLDFGGLVLEPRLAKIFAGLVSAPRLAEGVTAGLGKLEKSPSLRAIQRSQSLPERLRPLFCPVEVNFASDVAPAVSAGNQLLIPTEWLISPFFDEKEQLLAARREYQSVLKKYESKFPETDLPDADHAWLGPVKAHSDLMAISALISDKVIDCEFAADVLAVDIVNPAFSRRRCELLRLVPNQNSPSSSWIEPFKAALAAAKNSAAHELLANLEDAARDLNFHKRTAKQLLMACAARLHTAEGMAELYRLLLQRRQEIAASEISAHPRGQILEPGFRVIFPQSKAAPASNAFTLDAQCRLVPSA